MECCIPVAQERLPGLLKANAKLKNEKIEQLPKSSSSDLLQTNYSLRIEILRKVSKE